MGIMDLFFLLPIQKLKEQFNVVMCECELHMSAADWKNNGTPSRTLRLHEESPRGAVDAPEPADL